MLLNTKCPSWLYQVKVGATTVWERWDGLNEDGICEIGDDGTGGMISYNHYASGAVGDFLYRRIGGIETIEPAYKRFRIKPIMGGDISWAKASVQTPYGTVSSDWKIEDNKFVITIAVPMNTVCELTLPSGRNETVTSGTYTFLEEV
jgi:alpha-L-rhamnosidase